MTSQNLTERTADKLLFTPGPLTTSATVKAAMQRDLGSRDNEFIGVVSAIRMKLVQLAGQSDDSVYSTVIMQGSGTFGVEAVISSVIAPAGKLLVIINGAYGKRIAQIASVHHIATHLLNYPENALPDLAEIEAVLEADSAITAVAAVHCETTTGLFNPVNEIGAIAKRHNCVYILDAMSSFGAVPLDASTSQVDYLISSSNKCVEGVPGFSYVIARKTALMGTEGYARTVSLNLLAQWQELERSGQFRFTPPTHVLLAFHQALQELESEGGVEGRSARYRKNYQTLMTGMRMMGFREYLDPTLQGYIITTFLYPEHPN
ncbi:MAG TPA: 2-aminoethylphosphonate--pyruvate transaminase, partial [Aggregatilineales bacterium]|nr:2-aminoethylphosphonate--pyruvate transaminase [Aggregatilineales bacterium]